MLTSNHMLRNVVEGEILLTTSTSFDHSKFYSADSKAGADPRGGGVNPPSKKIIILLRGSPIRDPLRSGLAGLELG